MTNDSGNEQPRVKSGLAEEAEALRRHLEEVQSRITLLHHELERRRTSCIDPDTIRIKAAFQLLCKALLRRLGRRAGGA